MSSATPSSAEPEVRLLLADDLDLADQTMRIAFGTFLGMPEPERFMGDAQYTRTRWAADSSAAFAATVEGRFVGSNFATAWGSVGFFGPLTTHPSVWDRGIGRCLIGPALDYLNARGVRHAGLFTFSHSPKHIALYQRFGFWPRFLTLLLGKPVTRREHSPAYKHFSAMPKVEQETLLADCVSCTEEVHEGLDVSREINAVADQNLGDTVLLASGDRVDGFAVCHIGADTEAGSGTCYIKFAAVRPSANAARHFADLIHVCESFAIERGAANLVVGVNTACTEACEFLLNDGFRISVSGVSMHRSNEPAYCRPGVFACSDWR